MIPCPCLRLVLFLANGNKRVSIDELHLRPDAAVVIAKGFDDWAPDLLRTYRTQNDTLVCTVLDSPWESRSGIQECNLTIPHMSRRAAIALNRSTFDAKCPDDSERIYRRASSHLWMRSGVCNEDIEV